MKEDPPLLDSVEGTSAAKKLDVFLDQIKDHLMDRNTFAKTTLQFNVNVDNIPAIIPPAMRVEESSYPKDEVESKGLLLTGLCSAPSLIKFHKHESSMRKLSFALSNFR